MFDCVSLFFWDGFVRMEKGCCFVVMLVFEWGDGMYYVICWVILVCGLLCIFVVLLEIEVCFVGIFVGLLCDSFKLWGIVFVLGLWVRVGGE